MFYKNKKLGFLQDSTIKLQQIQQLTYKHSNFFMLEKIKLVTEKMIVS